MAKEPDPRRELARLGERLGAGPPPRAVLVRGDEPWFRAEALRLLVEAARRAELELARHDAADPDFDLARLLDDLAAAPMFASARCVLVRGADALLTGGGRAGTPLAAALESFLPSRLEGAVLLEAPGLRADSKVIKALAALPPEPGRDGLVLSFRKLYESPPPWGPPDPRRVELVEHTLERARARSLRLSPDDAVVVAAASGNDLAALERKLDALASGAVAERGAALGRTLGQESAPSPFEVASALCLGRLERAAPGIEALFRLGFAGKDGSRESEPRALCAVLFNALHTKLRQAERAARALAEGCEPEEAARRAGVPGWPRAREEHAALMASRPGSDWAGMAAELLALERRTRLSATVDASDFLALALAWRRPEPERRAERRAPARTAPRARGPRR